MNKIKNSLKINFHAIFELNKNLHHFSWYTLRIEIFLQLFEKNEIRPL